MPQETITKPSIQVENPKKLSEDEELETKENTEKTIFFWHIKNELQKIDNWENIFIIHQTTELNAIKILQSAYFSNSWLNWTALISNLESIINACYFLNKWQSWPWFQRHKDSNSLVIMSIKKEEFENCRNLNDIDWKLGEYIESKDINKYGLPNSCIWWYVNWVSYHRNINYTWSVLN